MDLRANGWGAAEYNVIEPSEFNVKECRALEECRSVKVGALSRRNEVLTFISWMGCRSCVLAVIVVFFLILGGLVVFVNASARNTLIASASYVLGMQVSVNNVDIGVVSAKSAITNFTVGNPLGLRGNAFEFDRAVFDLNLNSLVSRTIAMNEIHLYGVRVSIVSMHDGNSNVKVIDRHVSKRIKETRAMAHRINKFKGAPTKIIANKVAFSDINITISSEKNSTFHMAPVRIAGIRVVDVGHQSHGVHIYEFLEIITNAVMKAIAIAVPGTLHETLIAKFEKALDYGEMQVDIGSDVAG